MNKDSKGQGRKDSTLRKTNSKAKAGKVYEKDMKREKKKARHKL